MHLWCAVEYMRQKGTLLDVLPSNVAGMQALATLPSACPLLRHASIACDQNSMLSLGRILWGDAAAHTWFTLA
jgi:hypothetical protein